MLMKRFLKVSVGAV